MLFASRFTQWLWGKTNSIDSIQNETYDNLACPTGVTQNLTDALRALSLDDASQRNLPTTGTVLINGAARLTAWRAAHNATTPGIRSSDCSSCFTKIGSQERAVLMPSAPLIRL
jgi:hypothetical protein